MAQDRTTLKVSSRDVFGSRATRRLRKDGMVPGVVYGQGGEARPFQVPSRELRNVLQEGQTLLDLELEGSAAVPVVIKEQQHHPVRGDVTHLDFLEVRLDEEIQAEVAIELEGADNAPLALRSVSPASRGDGCPTRRSACADPGRRTSRCSRFVRVDTQVGRLPCQRQPTQGRGHNHWRL